LNREIKPHTIVELEQPSPNYLTDAKRSNEIRQLVQSLDNLRAEIAGILNERKGGYTEHVPSNVQESAKPKKGTQIKNQRIAKLDGEPQKREEFVSLQSVPVTSLKVNEGTENTPALENEDLEKKMQEEIFSMIKEISQEKRVQFPNTPTRGANASIF
jgi:hypothetical protein